MNWSQNCGLRPKWERRTAAAAMCVAAVGGSACLAQLTFDPPVLYTAGTPGLDRGLAAADVDLDGDMDLAGTAGAAMGVWLNAGDGNFAPARYFSTISAVSNLCVADLNADALPDLVGIGSSVFDVRTLMNGGAGQFTLGPAYTAGEGNSIAAGDLDGDGDIDLVSGDWNFHVYLARNTGQGQFAPATSINIYNRPRSIIVADLTADGLLDVATADDLSPAGATVLLGTGGGGFSAPLQYPAGINPRSIVGADLDGDGWSDLAVADASPLNQSLAGVSILRNLGNGLFAPSVVWTAGAQPLSIAAGDIDRDGDMDLVVANCSECHDPFTPNFGLSGVTVLLNDGGGAFPTAVLYSVGPADSAYGGERSVALADLDGDGDLDIASMGSTRSSSFVTSVTLSVLRNQTPAQAPLALRLRDPAPRSIPPGVRAELVVDPDIIAEPIDPASVMLWYRATGGAPFASVPAEAIEGGAFRAALPRWRCGDQPQYYFTARSASGAAASLPTSAPASVISSLVGALEAQLVMEQQFASAGLPAGWSAGSLWHITSACPPAGVCGSEPRRAYFGRDASCNYATGSWVAGTLRSAPIALPSLPASQPITISYCSALQTEGGVELAWFDVNSAGGLDDPTLDEVPGMPATWQTRTVDLTEYAGQTVTLTWTFDSEDEIDNGYHGWSIDNVRITASVFVCRDACAPDFNADGLLNSQDFFEFLASFFTASPDADFNGDGGVNSQDFFDFLAAFFAGC
jgi:hypothetical protein